MNGITELIPILTVINKILQLLNFFECLHVSNIKHYYEVSKKVNKKGVFNICTLNYVIFFTLMEHTSCTAFYSM